MYFSTGIKQQQTLNKEYSQSQGSNMNYPVNEAPNLHQQSYSSNYAPFDSSIQLNAAMHPVRHQHYPSEPQQYQGQHQHLYYDNTYNVPFIGDRMAGRGQVSSFYGNRARYFPYQHSIPPHSIRGMYTPAGQQLIPSSVLHYPPRSSSYEQNNLPLPFSKQSSMLQTQCSLPPHSQLQLRPHLRQQQQQTQSQSHRSTPFGGNEQQDYKNIDAPEGEFVKAMQTPSNLLMHLNGGDSRTSSRTSPVQIVSTPISLNQTRPLSADFDELSADHHERIRQVTPSPQQTPIVKFSPTHSTSSELPTMREGAQFSTRVASNGTASLASISNTSTISSPLVTANSDCLTTTPPLISATGTDSGISVSSCCTRIRSDSTHSTPAYNGEYPLSVGSSSGLSYHCSDIKELEEFSRENEESTSSRGFNENIIFKLKQEDTGDENNEERLIHGARFKENSYNMNEEENNKINSEYKTDPYESEALDCDSRVNATTTNTSLMPKTITPTNTSHGESKRSPEAKDSKNIVKELFLEENATKISNIEAEPKEHIKPNMCNEQKEANIQTGVFTRFDNTEIQQQELPSPPPAPPQNSPVGYFPSTSSNMNTFGYATAISSQLKPPSKGAAAAAAAAVVAAAAAAAAASIRTNKNRIMEFDSMTSKKTKRKINFLTGKWQKDNEEGETNESNRKNKDLTPLPGFQQAFGSTEIGRFFEKFLFSPPDFHNPNDGHETFDVGDQQQQPLQNQLPIKQENQQLGLNRIQPQIQQQQQQYTQHELFYRKYAEDNVYQTQRLHSRYPHPHLHYRHPYYRDQPYPYQNTAANNYRDMYIFGRPSHSLHDLPFEYGTSYPSSCTPSSPYEMPLNVRSAYGSSYDRIGYSYGIKNSNYGGIRCNGY
uniref:Uncharacterized protein n=1 Tax=Ceratitis capitata TaxID=7213 RepID=W8BPN0_CERCA